MQFSGQWQGLPVPSSDERQVMDVPEVRVKRVSSRDVAALAGVSQATVSRALQGDPRITVATRERVERAAEELGYIPNALGRNFVRSQTRQIGLVAADLSNPFYPDLLQAISAELDRRGYRPVLLLDNGSDDTMFRMLADGSLDGVILTSSKVDSSLPGRLLKQGVPAVLVNRYVDDVPTDSCVVDSVAGAILIAEHIVSLGHTEVALLSGSASSSTGRDRRNALIDAFAERGVDILPSRTLSGDFRFSEGQDNLRRLVESDPAITAVVCGNDILALGALDAARTLGISIPEDLTVIGFDDMPMAAWSMIGLTTVRQDTRGIGRAGVELLMRRLENPRLPPKQVAWAPELIVRTSDGPPRA